MAPINGGYSAMKEGKTPTKSLTCDAEDWGNAPKNPGMPRPPKPPAVGPRPAPGNPSPRPPIAPGNPRKF